MKLLLDTHIWIWSVVQPQRLGTRIAELLLDDGSEIWVSPVSTWELVLLLEKGRLASPYSVESWVEQARARSGWREAALTSEVVLAAAHLQLPHRDPSDRLLLATARHYGLLFATADAALLSLPGVTCQPNV